MKGGGGGDEGRGEEDEGMKGGGGGDEGRKQRHQVDDLPVLPWE